MLATLVPSAAADHDHVVVAYDASAPYRGTVALKARLLEPDSDCPFNLCPAANRQVDFYVNGAFVGTDVTNHGGYAYLLVAAAETWSVGTHTIRAQYDRSTRAATDEAVLTITEEAAQVLAFDAEAQYGDRVALRARLTAPASSCTAAPCPLAGRSIDFLVNGALVGSDETDGGGYANLVLTAEQAWHAGEHGVTAVFERATSPVEGEATLTITPETTIVSAHKGYFEAQLTDDDNEPLVGFPVRFSFETPAGEHTVCTAFTDAAGLARCVPVTGAGLSPLNAAETNYKATFDGETDYSASTDRAALI